MNIYHYIIMIWVVVQMAAKIYKSAKAGENIGAPVGIVGWCLLMNWLVYQSANYTGELS